MGNGMKRAVRWLCVVALVGGCSPSPHETGAPDAGDGGDLLVEAGPADAPADQADATLPSEGGTDGKVPGEGGAEGGPVVAPCATASMGPAGGTVAHPSGAKIVVPVGALAAATTLSLCPTSAAAASGGTAVGPAFEAGPEGQTFLAPVQVIVPFDATKLPPGSVLGATQVWTAPPGTSSFQPLQSSVDLAGGVVTSATTHFSLFVPEVSPSPVFIETTQLPQAMVGAVYTAILQATGGTPPYTWSLPAGNVLPPGLLLVAGGAIDGNPTLGGNFAFFLQVTDSAAVSVQTAISMTVLAPANPIPSVTSITPTAASQGSGDTVITVIGSGFAPGAQVVWDQSALYSTLVSPTNLAATVPAADFASTGTHQISVNNPPPDGGRSNAKPFTVTAQVVNPVPQVASLVPTLIGVSTVDLQVTINGSFFVQGATAEIASEPLATAYQSDSSVVAIVPAAYLATPGTLAIGVLNPPPGGGMSPTTVQLTVGSVNPAPQLTGLSPTSVGAGSKPFTLTVSGTSFVAGAQVFLAGTALSTGVSSATTAIAAVPDTLVVNPGSYPILIVDPQPGGGPSATLTFDVVADAGIADGGGDSAACALTVCGGACVDTSSDTANCGGCGIVCLAAGATCSSGQCMATCGGSQVDTSTDTANCGGCGVVCSATAPSTATCASGRCLATLATVPPALQSPGALAIDSSSVYWIDVGSNGALTQVPLSGGTPIALATGYPGFNVGPGSVAVDSTYVYWESQGTPVSIWRAPIGVGPDAGVELVPGLTTPVGIAVNAASVFFTDHSGPVDGPGVVEAVSTSGGPVTVLASVPAAPDCLAIDGTNVYWGNQGTNGATPSVLSMPLAGLPDGGAPTVLATSAVFGTVPAALAVDSTSVYVTFFSNSGPGYVAKVPIGGGPSTTLASGLTAPQGIAVDATSVYWVDVIAGTVSKVPLAGGPVTALATSASPQGPLAVDGTSVYFSSATAVMRITPK